ncbi:hypothetical protein ACFO4P_12935 [Epilithonimonas pallida]|uniref:Uncharacterized protein n=1 Tax=Epilithonimonas pallida TaxID=373671 RepID=A0ABY1R5J5_9FLAO|nr:hypothetical protein [Epilithonimonas pallida]SMP95463.1 hypothetical protein SAMN05421679_107133 [Epilithonimonas pallida]
MVVKINTDLFNQESSVNKIDRVLDYVLDRRYDLFFDDEEILENSYWIKEARENYKDLLIETFVQTVEGSKKFDVELSIDDDVENGKYSIDNGLIYLNNEVIIFVENAKYDSYFIKGLVSKFKKRGKKINRFIDKRWVKFGNCGGRTDAVSQISHNLSTYDTESLENFHYVRAILILDSDKTKKNDSDSERLRKEFEITEFCAQNKILLHILEKREMENYLPLSVIDGIEDVKKSELENLRSATKEEKDYYDFEKLSTRVYKTKHEFPKLFLSENLTQEMLLNECSHQDNPEELQMIIDKINSLI